MTRAARIILGYAVSVAVFALVLPGAVIRLGTALDLTFALPRWRAQTVSIVLAAVLGAWGLFWMLWSWRFLVTRGRGHPTEAFGIEVSPVTRELVTGGPYARTRNPMVFGYFFVLLAVAAYFGSAGMLVGIAVVAAIGWAQIAYFEEPRLERRFGEAYREYRRRVPRFLPLRRAGR